MTYKIYQVDAFTDQLFGGNPAAIVPLTEWIDEKLMQQIASENNLAETAFYVKKNDRFEIRWFTPVAEVDLCGHATLGSAFVLFNCEGFEGNEISFFSHKSGELKVNKTGNWLDLIFPADKVQQVDITPELESCFDIKPKMAYKGKTDYMLIYRTEEEVNELIPNLSKISSYARGIIVTAKGNSVDFVSRFFAPAIGVNEDPVTGSAHTTLIPYWSHELEKDEMVARQLSKRGGYLKCKNLDGKVVISGQGKLYMKGEMYL